jgi:hypothetical protein
MGWKFVEQIKIVNKDEKEEIPTMNYILNETLSCMKLITSKKLEMHMEEI